MTLTEKKEYITKTMNELRDGILGVIDQPGHENTSAIELIAVQFEIFALKEMYKTFYKETFDKVKPIDNVLAFPKPFGKNPNGDNH